MRESGRYQVELNMSGSVDLHSVGVESPVGKCPFVPICSFSSPAPSTPRFIEGPGVHSEDNGFYVCRLWEFSVLRSTLYRIPIPFINWQPQNSKYWVDLRLCARNFAWIKALKPAFILFKKEKVKKNKETFSERTFISKWINSQVENSQEILCCVRVMFISPSPS
jgi:hypothetical protein